MKGSTWSKLGSKLGSKLSSKIKAIGIIVAIFMPQALVLAANFDTIQSSGVDTIAGYSTTLQTSTNSSNQAVTFNVKKPNGSVITISTKTDAQGIAKTELTETNTHQAGQYFVSASLDGSTENGQMTSFNVHPDIISIDQSTVASDRTVAKAGDNDQITIDVILVDQYHNPYPNHLVNLISSRGNDKITAHTVSGLTDKNGAISFSVSSEETGISTYSAIDSTSNTVLTQRAQVAFVSKDNYLNDVGGDFSAFIETAKAAPGGSINHFVISDLPGNIQPGQNVSFRVTAQDENNQTVQNYTGQVHFSAEGANGNNVSLPQDYTFKAEDLGTHQFSLGLSFTLAGDYKILVTDLGNILIKSAKAVTISNNNNNGSQQNSPDQPLIITPTAGTYSQKTQTVSGNTGVGLTVKIFDNEQDIGTVQADNNGKFNFQTAPLTDGVHKIYVSALDANQNIKGTSTIVQFNVDSTPPTVDQINLQPNGSLQPGQVLNVDIITEENLSQATVIFDTNITQLNPSIDKPGHYLASIQSPKTPGIYPMNVILVDQLGNEGSYKGKAQITVSDIVTTTQENTQQTQQPTEQNGNGPSKVNGLISYAGDKKITLVWDAATGTPLIKHYRVYYGVSPSNLTQFADTFDASTSWYVPNLENGKEYYFEITAFDSNGIESRAKSEIVSAIPFITEVTTLPKTDQNALNQDNLHDAAFEAGVVPPRVSKSGPEIMWLFSGTGLASFFIQKIRRHRINKK